MQVEASLKMQRSEEAARGLEAELVTARQQLLHQQGGRRAKDKEAERLGRALEQLRGSEYEVTAKLLQVRAGCAAGPLLRQAHFPWYSTGVLYINGMVKCTIRAHRGQCMQDALIGVATEGVLRMWHI